MCFSTVEVVNLPAAAAAGGTARLAPMWQGAGRLLQSSCANVTSRVTNGNCRKSLRIPKQQDTLRRAKRDDENRFGFCNRFRQQKRHRVMPRREKPAAADRRYPSTARTTRVSSGAAAASAARFEQRGTRESLAAVVSLIGRLLEQRSADETEALYARDRQPHGSASHAQPCWARARRVTLWSCWAPRVPRLQVSRGVTELCWRLATERVQYVQKTRVFSGDIRENLG
jgi:hypothetical protein